MPLATAEGAAAALVAALDALATGAAEPEAAADAGAAADAAGADAAVDGAADAAGLVADGGAEPNGFAWPADDAGAELAAAGVLVAEPPPHAARNAAVAAPSSPPMKARREIIVDRERSSTAPSQSLCSRDPRATGTPLPLPDRNASIRARGFRLPTTVDAATIACCPPPVNRQFVPPAHPRPNRSGNPHIRRARPSTNGPSRPSVPSPGGRPVHPRARHVSFSQRGTICSPRWVRRDSGPPFSPGSPPTTGDGGSPTWCHAIDPQDAPILTTEALP